MKKHMMLETLRGAVCLFVVTLLLPFAANADTFTWTGGGANKKWSTAANWNPNGTMTASDTANFQTGTLSSDTITYDTGAFKNITVQSGAWTANVATARFTEKPITIASGATFALAGASAAVNPFATNLNANAVAGLLDLGGAKQTISTTIPDGDEGFFRNGGEIRNGTLTIDGTVSASFKSKTFTIGSGANVTGAVRLYLNGAQLVIDGGSFNDTQTGSNHPIGNVNNASVTVRNGGRLTASQEVWLGFKKQGQLIGDGATIDLGGNTLFIAVRDNAPSVLALTNSTLTCGVMDYGYSTQYTVGKQTVILKDTVVSMTRFNGIVLNSGSSLLFDGTTLVPKSARTDFLPNSAALPTPTLGAGGLTISNAYDITIAKGLAGTGSLVKTGDATLTLASTNTFTGGIDLRKGMLAIDASAVFPNSTLAMADGTTLKVKFSPEGGFATTNILPVLNANTQGRVTVEIDTTAGLPEEGRAYTLFAPGLSMAALNRITVVPDAFYTVGWTQNGALTLTLPRVPKTHVWTGEGTDAKWTTMANWEVANDFGTLDTVVFGGTGGYSIYDCTDGLYFESINVNSGCHTANVATASFVRSPIMITNEAAFVLENANGVTNPFSTNKNANAVAGLLDLGGASQTITTPIDGNNTGFFRDGCEIRNGTLTIDPQTAGASIRFKDTTITVGPGANVSGVVRVDLNNAHFVIDGGTFTSTYADRDIGNHPIGRTAASSIVLRNGGRFVSASELWIGFNANGTVVGNDSEIDLGSQILYMSINGIESVLALTNSTLTCGWFRFGYSGGANPGVQTVSLKDTIVNVTKFVGTKLNPESSLLFDGATLVPKAAATDFMPASANLPTPTIGAGGLTVSNAYDVTIAKGLAGAGGLVKKGDGALTLSGPNTFTGGIDVQAGALAIAGDASFANTMLNMADGTTLKVKFSPGSGFATSNIVLALDANTQGSVAIEIDLSTGMPEPNRVYTLFAPGLNAATLNRLSIDPAFSPAFSENGALTLTFSPKIHAWMGGGADAKWTTAVNWNISDPIVTYDHVVFSGISGYSIYDCADGLRLASITAGFGVHTANVETACFANVPITVAGGATFALENASGVTNAFSTVANTNVIAGVLDLGGAAQTISTTMAGNDAGSFRDGGEIRNGALTLISSTEQNLNNTAFTFGSGSRVSSSSRIYLQYGAHLTIDGGTYTNTFTGNNHVIGANSGVSTLEVSNGGCFVAKRPWFIGHTANGSLIGDGGIIDVGAQPLYLSNQNAAQSVLALTNAVLTCGEIQFAYSTSGGNTQTLILKNSLVNLSSFLFRHKTAASSILFDGATLVPKAASASFIPTGLPTPVLGAGGLIISNAFDVSVAVGMTGEGGIVKKGNAKLTVTDNQSFGGDVIVSNGTFTTSSEFAGGLRAMSDATIDVADAMFGGDIVIEDGVALTATNGVDWATTKFVPIAKTTANASYPSRADADGRHFFVRQQGGVQTLCYGRKAGLVIMMR